jgi:poly(A) polymerase
MNLTHPIFSSGPFKTLISLATKEKQEIYLVGGFLRDLYLGRSKEALDLDFSLKSGAIDFGSRLARALKAGFVVLDKERGCCRVVCRDKKIRKTLTFDFIDFRGKDLKEDLLRRDFTLNTLVVKLPLKLPLKGSKVEDFYGARRDIKKKIVRVVDDASFDEDPLRILRAFSLSAIFGFKIEARTLALIKKKRAALKEVAGERCRDEFFKILGTAQAWRFIAFLDRCKVLEIIIPQVIVMRDCRQGGYHHLDVWGHSLETVKKLEELMVTLRKNKDIHACLDEVMAADRKRVQLLKLAALLHDIGKPKAFEVKAGKTMFHGHERIGRIISDSVCERLKLATREKFALDTIIFWHLRPGYLADNEVLTKRAVHRFFRDTQEEAVSVLLVSIADQRATRGPLATAESRKKHEKVAFALLKKYFEKLKETPFKRLIDGKDLIGKLRLRPGPVFSVVLNAVEEAQVEGRVTTKAQALVLARRVAEKAPQEDKKIKISVSGGKMKS